MAEHDGNRAKNTPGGPRMPLPPPHRCPLHDMWFPACGPVGTAWIGGCVGFEGGEREDKIVAVLVGKKGTNRISRCQGGPTRTAPASSVSHTVPRM